MKTKQKPPHKWTTKKKSIEIGNVLLVQDGHGRLWLYGDSGEAMNLTPKSIEKLEGVLESFMMDNF
jgi:hypothetical protein